MDDSIVNKDLKKEDWFEIIAKNPDSASPNFAFRWCIHKKAREKLLQEKVAFPFLVITVWDRTGSYLRIYSRAIYPLDQGMGYIDFRRPDNFELSASIIWVDPDLKASTSYKSARNVVGWLMNYNAGNSSHSLHDLESYRPDFLDDNLQSLDFHDFLEIKIDENLFSKELPDWFGKWVNLFYKKKAKNECELRRRMLWCILKLPYAFLIYAPIRVFFRLIVVTVALLLGYRFRAIKWKNIFQPFDATAIMVVDGDWTIDPENLWWVTKKDGENRHWLEQLILCPGIHLVTIIIIVLLFKNSPTPSSSIVFYAMFFLVLSWGIFYSARSNGFIDKKLSEDEILALKQKKRMMLEQELTKKMREYYDQRISPLSCRLDSKKVSVKSLPKSHRSIWLRYKDLKAKVCKPLRQ